MGRASSRRISELSSRGCLCRHIQSVSGGHGVARPLRYGCSTCELPGNVTTHTPTTAWACVSVRPQRRIAPRSTPGWKNSLGNRPDPRRHKSYLPNHAEVLAACGITLTCNHVLQSKWRAAMTSPLDNGILLLLLKVYGAMIPWGRFLLRAQFRFKAKLNPQLVSRRVAAPRCPAVHGASREKVLRI